MFDNQQFREEIIRKPLQPMGLWQPNSEELLVMTCAQESLGGKYLRQIKGPALGPFEMEPNTADDIWKNYLNARPLLVKKIYDVLGITSRPPDEAMIYNLWYATIMARLFYERIHQPIPDAKDIEDLAKYYKIHFNSLGGKATIEEVLENYHRFVGQK